MRTNKIDYEKMSANKSKRRLGLLYIPMNEALRHFW